MTRSLLKIKEDIKKIDPEYSEPMEARSQQADLVAGTLCKMLRESFEKDENIPPQENTTTTE